MPYLYPPLQFASSVSFPSLQIEFLLEPAPPPRHTRCVPVLTLHFGIMGQCPLLHSTPVLLVTAAPVILSQHFPLFAKKRMSTHSSAGSSRSTRSLGFLTLKSSSKSHRFRNKPKYMVCCNMKKCTRVKQHFCGAPVFYRSANYCLFIPPLPSHPPIRPHAPSLLCVPAHTPASHRHSRRSSQKTKLANTASV